MEHDGELYYDVQRVKIITIIGIKININIITMSFVILNLFYCW